MNYSRKYIIRALRRFRSRNYLLSARMDPDPEAKNTIATTKEQL